MKKALLLLFVLPLAAATAQPSYSNLDTVTGLPAHYYVPAWYNICPSFRADTASFIVGGHILCDHHGWSPNNVVVREFSTDAPREILGMVALVNINPGFPTPMADPTAGRAPEYLMLLQGTDTIAGAYYSGDTTQPIPSSRLPRHMTILDSLRWDTVTPLILRLPKKHNAVADADFFHCYAYECRFPAPVTVDSVFYVLGTYRSNYVYENYRMPNYPTAYYYIDEQYDIQCNRCDGSDNSRVFAVSHFPDTPDALWSLGLRNEDLAMFGLFFPIIDEPEAK